MVDPLKFRGVMGVCLVLSGVFASRAMSQEFSSPLRDPATALLRDAEEEARRGTYIFYTQAYKDQHKEKVSLHGSVYGVLRDVKVEGCDLDATVQVFDLFSGFVGERPEAERQDLTEYSIHFRISSGVAASVFQARPSQLAHSMHSQCDGDGSCTFNWIRIRSSRPLMRERIVLNHSITFDGAVSEVLVPVSSKETADQLIRDLENVAQSQCQ
jgi:hypothetical protein